MSASAARVAAMLEAKAKEPIETLVKTLTLIKSPDALSAEVMRRAARYALEMADFYETRAEQK